MINGIKLIQMAAMICLPVLSWSASAEDDNTKLNDATASPYAKQVRTIVAAEDAAKNPPPSNPNLNFKEPWISGAKVHEYLGLATLVSVAATAMTAPSHCTTNCTTGTHQNLGRTSAALALATVTTGVIFHWKDMHLIEDGLSDPDTQHWLLGGAGALIMADAVSKAPAKSHSSQAELGAAMMLVAIKINW